jgi:hypothetical protein
MDSEKDKKKKVCREFRLRNLKRVAEKNQVLYKIAKKNMIQAFVLSIAYVLFGAIFFSWPQLLVSQKL